MRGHLKFGRLGITQLHNKKLYEKIIYLLHNIHRDDDG